MPVFSKLPSPVTSRQSFVLPATLDVAAGRAAVRRVIEEGLLAPSDVAIGRIEDAALLYVPFWRVAVGLDIVMVCARRAFPYEVKLPSALQVGTNELVSFSNAASVLEAGEVVDADLERVRAEAVAIAMAKGGATAEPTVHASTLCYYPLYYERYRYDGEARRHRGEELFVALSGRSGDVVSAKHPSSLRALTNKLRKLLSFDRR